MSKTIAKWTPFSFLNIKKEKKNRKEKSTEVQKVGSHSEVKHPRAQ